MVKNRRGVVGNALSAHNLCATRKGGGPAFRTLAQTAQARSQQRLEKHPAQLVVPPVHPCGADSPASGLAAPLDTLTQTDWLPIVSGMANSQHMFLSSPASVVLQTFPSRSTARKAGLCSLGRGSCHPLLQGQDILAGIP